MNPPVPGGPIRDLCPVNASTSAPVSAKSMSSTPAVCAVSRMKKAPASWAILPASTTGNTEPSTFDA
ncbi:MAG: hypothetical protein BWY85_00772 [Firmicutes bacterium ADurb.Bin506]|nr:MAG: hypothetical protein BWY85_00772 [Firmicutes bacterium ADurb.Bin506]